MSFLQPLLLWGVLGISLPILIHLLNRYRVRELDWAAMKLLRLAVVTRSRRVRLEDVLLLALRGLAILFLALALARPALTVAAGLLRGAQRQAPGLLIALDGSYSMGYQQGVSVRFGRATKMVRDVLRQAQPGTRVAIVLMGQRPRVLYKTLSYNPEAAQEVLENVRGLAEPLALEPNLEAVLGLLKEMDVPQRDCYFVTDAQRASWGELSPEARERLAEIATYGNVFLLPCDDEGRENVAVSDLRPVSGQLIQGGLVRFVADVRNTGRRDQQGVKVQLALDDAGVDEKLVDVPAGQTIPVFLFARLKQSGPVRVTARLSPDALLADNARHAVLHVRSALRVLVVDGEASPAGAGRGASYLATALAPQKGARAATAGALQVEIVSRPQLAGVQIMDYQIVMLIAVSDLPAATVSTLHDFLTWGGGLVVFGGEPFNPRLANLTFRSAGAPFLPCEILDAQGDAERQDRPLALEIVSADHLLTQPLARLPGDLVREALFYRAYKLKPYPGTQEILRLEDGSPLLVERAVGQGKVLFFASTADDQWTNFPKTVLFPLLIQQEVSFLTQHEGERARTIGDALQIPLPPEWGEDQVVLTDPLGERSTLKVPAGEARRAVTFPRADAPGFYTLRRPPRAAPAGKAGTDTILDGQNGICPHFPDDRDALRVAVNVDTRESDVECLQGEQLAQAFRGLPIHVLANSQDMPAELDRARHGVELWRPFLFAALLLFLLEAWLAHRFSQAHAPEAAVASAFARLRAALLPGDSEDAP